MPHCSSEYLRRSFVPAAVHFFNERLSDLRQRYSVVLEIKSLYFVYVLMWWQINFPHGDE